MTLRDYGVNIMNAVKDNSFGYIYTYKLSNKLKERQPEFDNKKEEELKTDENNSFSSLLQLKINSLS